MKLTRLLIFVSGAMAGCVTADQDLQTVDLGGASGIASLAVHRDHSATEDGAEVRVFVLRPDASLYRALLSNLIVDNREAALVHLARDYHVAVVTVRNASSQTLRLDKALLRIEIDNSVLEPIRQEDFPKTISCINWKGNFKNAYNTTVISLATAYTVGAILSCVSEGKCEALGRIGDVLDAATSGETDGRRTFSDPVFTSQIRYSNVINLDAVTLPAGAEASGLVLYRKPVRLLDAGRIATAANCVVE